jgi:GT2 family glycosyltransferase
MYQGAASIVTLSAVLYKTSLADLSGLLHACSSVRGVSLSVCIVDNSPTDELRMTVASYGFTYFHRPDNPGFGSSHNFAFMNAGRDSKYHFIVNPDVQFGEDDLAALVDYMARNDDVGMVAPKVKYPDGAIQYNRTLLPVPMNLFLRRFCGRIDFAEKLNSSFELRFVPDDRVLEVPALSGCFMLVRSSIYREIGGFDERFFMYLEDSDLTRRIGKKSKTMYYPFVTIVHEHGRGSYKINRLLIAHVLSAVRYFNKWGWWFDRDRDLLNQKTLRQLTEAN